MCFESPVFFLFCFFFPFGCLWTLQYPQASAAVAVKKNHIRSANQSFSKFKMLHHYSWEQNSNTNPAKLPNSSRFDAKSEVELTEAAWPLTDCIIFLQCNLKLLPIIIAARPFWQLCCPQFQVWSTSIHTVRSKDH